MIVAEDCATFPKPQYTASQANPSHLFSARQRFGQRTPVRS
jgi:hypothetical protein